MGARTDMQQNVAVVLATALLLVTFAPLLSAVGCEAACALDIMPVGHCGHTMSSGGASSDSGTMALALAAQQGLSVAVIAVGLLLALAAPSRVTLRVVPVGSSVDLTGTRIRI